MPLANFNFHQNLKIVKENFPSTYDIVSNHEVSDAPVKKPTPEMINKFTQMLMEKLFKDLDLSKYSYTGDISNSMKSRNTDILKANPDAEITGSKQKLDDQKVNAMARKYIVISYDL